MRQNPFLLRTADRADSDGLGAPDNRWSRAFAYRCAATCGSGHALSKSTRAAPPAPMNFCTSPTTLAAAVQCTLAARAVSASMARGSG